MEEKREAEKPRNGDIRGDNCMKGRKKGGNLRTECGVGR